MKIAIAGYDTEGKSSLRYFQSQTDPNDGKPHEITVLDYDTGLQVPDGIASVLGERYLDGLERFDLIVRTPGLRPERIFAANPDLPRSKITSQVNEFFKVSPTKNIIGITGTKGKGTTSTIVTEVLKAAGKDAHLAGNIGVPALDLLDDITPDSWVVLELSSFQLIDLRFSPMIAVCLMVVPEHLNWHADMAEYKTAKQQLFVWQTFDDIAIYFNDSEHSRTIASAGNGAKVPYMSPPGAVADADGAISIGGQVICRTDELKLLGQHNWQNVCAALTAVWQVTHNVKAIREVLTTFSGLPHRLEFVRELRGVRYYDDSFGTTPETAIVAIKAFSEPKVVILGGSDKGADYADLAKTVKQSDVRKVLLIGEQAGRIQEALQQAGFTDFEAGGQSMAEIVTTAMAVSKAGDVVLLSTGCASFGMFKNYKDRAQKFIDAVNDLP